MISHPFIFRNLVPSIRLFVLVLILPLLDVSAVENFSPFPRFSFTAWRVLWYVFFVIAILLQSTTFNGIIVQILLPGFSWFGFSLPVCNVFLHPILLLNKHYKFNASMSVSMLALLLSWLWSFLVMLSMFTKDIWKLCLLTKQLPLTSIFALWLLTVCSLWDPFWKTFICESLYFIMDINHTV